MSKDIIVTHSYVRRFIFLSYAKLKGIETPYVPMWFILGRL